jgi:hypothetical protein
LSNRGQAVWGRHPFHIAVFQAFLSGEYLVAAELCRLGLVAAPFAGNVPHYDVIASDPRGGHLAVQVKTIRGSSWQFDIRSFLDASFDGRRQVLGRAKREPYPRLACVLVALKNGTPDSADRFFVLPWRKLRAIVVRGYRRYLMKHGYVRPRSPESFHTKVDIAEVAAFEQRWELICGRRKRT